MKIYRISDISSGKIIYVNNDDYASNFWGHNYSINVGATDTIHFVVNAANEDTALDYIIDYMEWAMPKQLFPIDDKPGNELMETYISGGKHGRFMTTPSNEILINEVPTVNSKNILLELKTTALEDCAGKGHKMGEWIDDLSPAGKGTSSNKCKMCGKGVMVDNDALSNEIDIGGEAIAMDCSNEYEMATPEELKRELGIG